MFIIQTYTSLLDDKITFMQPLFAWNYFNLCMHSDLSSMQVVLTLIKEYLQGYRFSIKPPMYCKTTCGRMCIEGKPLFAKSK